MKKHIFLCLVVIWGINADAQQLQSTSFYEVQSLLHNPSVAGVQNNGMIGATYRTQWSGIDGSPVTVNVFGSFALPKQNIGIGGSLYADKTGPTSRKGLNLYLAKHINMSKGTLSLGLEARMQQYMIDIDKLLQTLGPADPVLGNGDSKFKFDASFGASYTSEKFQVGASVSQLIQSKLDFYTGNLSRSAEARLYRHYYFHGVYFWQVDEANRIIPHALFVYLPNAPLEFQGGVRIEHNNLLWWDLSLRAKQSWLISAGLKLNKRMNFGYSFEIYRTPLSVYETGSNAHEFMLRYDLKGK